jgi:hypothetical protein
MADSVLNLTQRIEAKLPKSPGVSDEVKQNIEVLAGGYTEPAPSGGLPEITSSGRV